MAKIKLSGLITEIRGSVGGTTFQNSANGTVMKNKPNQLNFVSQKKYDHNGIMAQLNYAYDSLSSANATKWSACATALNISLKRSHQKTYSGRELFFSYNYYLLNDSVSIITNPCLALPVPISYTATLDFFSGELGLYLNYTIDSSEQILVFFISRPVPFNCTSPRSRLRLLSSLNYSNAFKLITDHYELKLGTIPCSGQKVFVKSRIQHKNYILNTPWINQTLIIT